MEKYGVDITETDEYKIFKKGVCDTEGCTSPAEFHIWTGEITKVWDLEDIKKYGEDGIHDVEELHGFTDLGRTIKEGVYCHVCREKLQS